MKKLYCLLFLLFAGCDRTSLPTTIPSSSPELRYAFSGKYASFNYGESVATGDTLFVTLSCNSDYTLDWDTIFVSGFASNEDVSVSRIQDHRWRIVPLPSTPDLHFGNITMQGKARGLDTVLGKDHRLTACRRAFDSLWTLTTYRIVGSDTIKELMTGLAKQTGARIDYGYYTGYLTFLFRDSPANPDWFGAGIDMATPDTSMLISLYPYGVGKIGFYGTWQQRNMKGEAEFRPGS